MAVGPLPDHEQRVLDEVEEALRHDRRLERRLRTLRWGPGWGPGAVRAAVRHPRTRTVALLLGASVALMIAGITTSAPGVIWALAVVWPLTLFEAFWLLCRWTER